MSRPKLSRRLCGDQEKDEFFCVKWVDQNKYSTLHVSKMPGSFSKTENLAEVVGKFFDFKWSDGLLYMGEVVNYGKFSHFLIFSYLLAIPVDWNNNFSFFFVLLY